MSNPSIETHLSTRLRKAIEENRIETERLMLGELTTLAKNLKDASDDVLNLMSVELTSGAGLARAGLEAEVTLITRNLAGLTNTIHLTTAEIDSAFQTSNRRLKRTILWIPASLAAMTVASSVGAYLWMTFLRSTAEQLQTEIRHSRATISQMSISGMSFVTTTRGRFLILPKPIETGWTCGNDPCVKIPEN